MTRMWRRAAIPMAVAVILAGWAVAWAYGWLPVPARAAGIQATLVTRAESIELPPVTHRTLHNGLDVWVVERHRQPLAHVTLMLPVGQLQEPAGKEGIADFTAAMLRQGTRQRSAEEIARAIDFVGGALQAQSGAERTMVTARVLARDTGLALDLIADVVQHPTFPAQEVEILRQQMLGAVRQQRDDPSALASAHAAAFFYGAGHPLGRPESESSVKAITPEDLAQFHREHYGPKGAVLVAVGDLDPSWVVAEVERRFGAWTGPAVPAAPATAAPAVPRVQESRLRWVAKPGQTQVQIRLRQNGPARTDDDWVAVELYNYILGGGGFSSRLMQVVRSQLGQTYGIGTGYTAYRFAGGMQLSTFTRNDRVWATLDAIQGELRRFYDEGVTDAELAAAKSHLLGSFPLRLETLGGMASAVVDALFFEGDLNALETYPQRVAATTREAVNAAIRRHVDPAHFAVVLLGDPEVLAKAPERVAGVARGAMERVDWDAPVEGWRSSDGR